MAEEGGRRCSKFFHRTTRGGEESHENDKIKNNIKLTKFTDKKAPHKKERRVRPFVHRHACRDVGGEVADARRQGWLHGQVLAEQYRFAEGGEVQEQRAHLRLVWRVGAYGKGGRLERLNHGEGVDG